MSNKGNGVFGSSVSGLAGAFNGKVSVLGDIIITGKIHNAQAHRLIVEKDKEAKERGYYIHPELYAQPDERDVRWVQNSG